VAASRGIPLAPHYHPSANAKLARLAVHYLNARNFSDGAAFGMAVWDRYFGHGADISTKEDLLQAGHEHISMSELGMARENEAAIAALDRANAAAEMSGCFGVPWFIVDGEAFFGQDRLELIDWWLERREPRLKRAGFGRSV
jgi:2-hydroxychromene-2-carboxylate isomerase